MATRVLLLLVLPALALSLCPMMGGKGGFGNMVLPPGHPNVNLAPAVKAAPGYVDALKALDLHAVKEDLKKLFVSSQDWWPADYGNYGPFFVRLAWHCSGSYRTSDGRGGCEGGRQRFDPERSWADNTNLDKARKLLLPIKNKYGLGLSWGDLFILAGTTAVESMGGPTIGFCAGRVDDPDGFWSQELGPTIEQEEFAPCPVNGTCVPPLGTTTIGLIYLNPEGPMGQPNPEESALQVRDTFRRMAMNDTETVALIGGGHAFGKTHGACPKGAGPSPKEDPSNPWPGECGTGKGLDAFTSGFEGPWTIDPTSFDNNYFELLTTNEFEVVVGAGGHHQWEVSNATKDRPTAPAAHGSGRQNVMMLTTDISLTRDPTGEYQKIVEYFAKDQAAFANAFSHAWYKLTTRDMGPVTRCVGDMVPPPQPFQYPLPPMPPPEQLADFDKVRPVIAEAITTAQPSVLPPDVYDGKAYYGALFVRLAWQCASTFRVTDYLGGCNGARLRFTPEKTWPVNADLDKALNLLAPIKEQFGTGLSWADLIALAGTVAVEQAGGLPLKFCGGRTDAVEGSGSEYLTPRLSGEGNATAAETIENVRATVKIMGLSDREWTALNGGGHSLGQKHTARSGFNGTWTASPTKLDNTFFSTLLEQDWTKVTVEGSNKTQYQASTGQTMLATDMVLKWDPEMASIAQEYAADNDLFLREFAAAWTKMMNADRFDGPAGNVCDTHSSTKLVE